MALVLPEAMNAPPTRGQVLQNNAFTSWWENYWQKGFDRIGGEDGRPIVGQITRLEINVKAADLASAAQVALMTAREGEQWKIIDIFLSGAGTNFSGGDRNLAITDGTSTWTVITAAGLQSLAFARWGDTTVPAPTTAADHITASAAGTNVSAQYSGGATDYNAGEGNLVLVVQRVA